MESKEKTFKIYNEKEAIEYLRKNQGTKPFNCPHLLIVPEKMKHGSTMFEKGDLLCTDGFLDICCIFNRARADDKGNIVAKCRKCAGDIKISFRKE
ncbi:hypothetical protein KY359_05530 [Candidatus Woesearchaeota archaeon]|nr:hypothetical protein [Candidatus Woesearchaeota archaeon]